MSESILGGFFPPHSALDIAAYDHAEVAAGYVDWRADDPEPGPNRPPSYRWGWANAKRDRQGGDDGYDWVRCAYLRDLRQAAA